jgi:hypothetical protein
MIIVNWVRWGKRRGGRRRRETYPDHEYSGRVWASESMCAVKPTDVGKVHCGLPCSHET